MGRLFKDTDPHKFIEYSKQALEMNVIAGRTSAAANIAKELATSLEENYQMGDAAYWYERAAQIYGNENNMTTANQM